ncbi:MFS transporter [Stenotrophomonas rhizophila]|uniref:MFS transporter n=1 Tax=Stenotrophomonas rhizophila TaxID=216778 RepID=UPI001E599C9B|nr:MFS transporter [Stenotrophomonas rhizophila]MCC7633579.1 MFS transporter [Stenotrophomonas rhizophila]MCC7662936.1 MFS transporter [Stenotrophomonas rhizophila]
MHNPYRTLFAAPGTGRFALAGVLARLPLPMTGISIITLLAQLRGSYALAGAVAATFVLTYALLSPQISRKVDRYGQSHVLPVVTTVSVVGMALLLAAAWRQAPAWTLFAGAALAGFMPSMSAMVRARWAALYRGQPRLQTAYSLETVLDEVTFIVGPPLAVGLSVAVDPLAGLLTAAVLLALGVAALVVQRGSEPALHPLDPGDRDGSAIGVAGVRLLALLMVAMGVIVGTVDIASVAFADQRGAPGAASAVLSAYAIGSCVAGLVFGATQLRVPLHRLLLFGGVATALSTLPLLLVDSIAGLAAAVLVAGLFFAPTMIVAMSIVERLVPAHRLTEGMTWLLAGLNVGVALGAAGAGQVVDLIGARAGFTVALGGGALVALTALWAHRRRPAHTPAISLQPASTHVPSAGSDQ